MKTIRTSNYVSIEAEYGHGSVELECWPTPEDSEVPVFFRFHGRYGATTQGVKLHDETWEAFFSRFSDGFELKPIMRELAATL